MFTIEQIKAAHSKVKSGADFPVYVQDLVHLGVLYYDNYVSDGHIEYAGANNYRITSYSSYAPMEIPGTGNNEQFIAHLKLHQQGGTDYPTFCNHAAETGVEKWTVNMATMTCTYYDKAGNVMLEEQIPAV